jgi:hypothetical protein
MKGIHIQPHRLMGGIYEVCHSDELRCRDIQYISSFIKIGSGVKKLIRRIDRHTDIIEIA